MTALFGRMLVLAAEAGEIVAAAEEPVQQTSSMDALWSLLPFILIIVAFFWLMSRSTKKRQRQRQEMIDSIGPKDDIVTVGGLHGRVVRIKDDELILCIDREKDVKITIAKVGIGRKLGEEEIE